MALALGVMPPIVGMVVVGAGGAVALGPEVGVAVPLEAAAGPETVSLVPTSIQTESGGT